MKFNLLKNSSPKVIPYDIDSLAAELSNDYIDPEEVKNSKSEYLRYFSDYFGNDGLKAKTMVLEYNYISKSFLNDYASYYSLCYKSYARETKRIHFFHLSLHYERSTLQLKIQRVNLIEYGKITWVI